MSEILLRSPELILLMLTVVWVVSILLISCSKVSLLHPMEPFHRTQLQMLFYYFEHFSQLVVFYQSLSDDKSLKDSRTFLSILTDLSNVVVWLVSVCPLISQSPSFLNNPLVIVRSAPTTSDITVTFIFLTFFNSLTSFRYPFFYLLILPCGYLERQSPQFSSFSFFVDYHSVWLSGRD